MASTYAFPVQSAARPHSSHAHSRSHVASDRPPPWNGQINGPSAVKKGPTRYHHQPSGLDGQLGRPATSAPYAASREYRHAHAGSLAGSLSIKTLVRPKMRPRGESDLGRPASMRNLKANGDKPFGISPIQETAAHPPPSSYVGRGQDARL